MGACRLLSVIEHAFPVGVDSYEHNRSQAQRYISKASAHRAQRATENRYTRGEKRNCRSCKKHWLENDTTNAKHKSARLHGVIWRWPIAPYITQFALRQVTQRTRLMAGIRHRTLWRGDHRWSLLRAILLARRNRTGEQMNSART